MHPNLSETEDRIREGFHLIRPKLSRAPRAAAAASCLCVSIALRRCVLSPFCLTESKSSGNSCNPAGNRRTRPIFNTPSRRKRPPPSIAPGEGLEEGTARTGGGVRLSRALWPVCRSRAGTVAEQGFERAPVRIFDIRVVAREAVCRVASAREANRVHRPIQNGAGDRRAWRR